MAKRIDLTPERITDDLESALEEVITRWARQWAATDEDDDAAADAIADRIVDEFRGDIGEFLDAAGRIRREHRGE